MASAYFIEKDAQWVADFRPLGGKDKQRRRIRLDRKRFASEDKATGLAQECERYCRLLEGEPDDRDIDHAERIGAITEGQASQLRRGLPAGAAARAPGPMTLKEAAEMHPATVGEMKRHPMAAVRYLAYLAEFCDHFKVRSVYDVKVSHVTAWIQHLERQGYSWHARRHRLMYLRRACRMAQSIGLPDPISGLKIDRRPMHDPPAPVYTLDELGALLHHDDPRIRLAVALGGFMGLRPSEIFRAYPEDLHKDVLTVGKRVAKNRSSMRSLPMPATMVRWWKEIDATPGEPILQSKHHGGAAAFDASGMSMWMLRAADVAPKRLRKSFATWARRVIPGRDVERYMGHQSAFLAAVTSNWYTGEEFADELRPSARKIDVILKRCYAKCLRSRKSSPRRRSA